MDAHDRTRIAAAATVSESTVRRFLRGKVATHATTRRRIWRAMEDLGLRPGLPDGRPEAEILLRQAYCWSCGDELAAGATVARFPNNAVACGACTVSADDELAEVSL